MPHVEYREPATMREALDPSRPGRLVDLDRMPGQSGREWKMRAGQVWLGFLVRYGPSRWLAHGVFVKAHAEGPSRDLVVRDYVARLRAELNGSEQQ